MRTINLNKAQQEAVDHIYGPLLVLAGPGTGKTQLLSARIANILQKTDANAQNILCLTFTEAAAQNMRERLSSIIKDDAYDVHINTYHGFGSDIIKSYPEFFETIDLETGKDSRLEKPIDALQQIQIMTAIIATLPFSSPLIGARHYIKHVVSTISEVKRGLISPDELRNIASNNLRQVQSLSPKIADHIGIVKSLPRTAEKSIELFSGIEQILEGEGGLAELANEALQAALAEAIDSNKSKPLTEWKNTWLTKDENNRFRFTDESQHQRIAELATIYERYQRALEEKQLYDFDDMILRTITALQTNDELRFNLQEKYQFILLDEFQDTNKAQFELVMQLANNPVNEGQPNIFAVGDDDQAIYAFQGARVSNMLAFKNAFRDVRVVNLTENYRSHPDILHAAHNVALQIESRLHHNLENIEKTLIASSNTLPVEATIERHEFTGKANEYAWVARRVASLLSTGVNPSEIVILAPKHSLLEDIVPFLSKANIPVTYEKREDILQTPLVRSLALMAELIIACKANDTVRMNQLFPQVLSLEFYQIPVVEIWQVNWALRNDDQHRSWVEIALESTVLGPHAIAYLSLGIQAEIQPLEFMLDFMIGSSQIAVDENTTYTSPMKEFYFGESRDKSLQYFEMLANLSAIREHLRAYQQSSNELLRLEDLLIFIQSYKDAEQPLINTHPIAQAKESVSLMTTYKAKGLEFEHVFLLSVHDDIWGKKARGNANKISLPANMQHIRYQGSSEDELRRLLFVAITRAKHGLYLTSHAMKDSGKKTESVKYLLEFNDGEVRKTTVLPVSKQILLETTFDAVASMQHIETLWESRHLQLTAELKSLLKDRLDRYQMSPTHLNTFIDLEYGGPETFLLQTLLRFPQAPGEDGEFGNAVHATLEQVQKWSKNSDKIVLPDVLKEFDAQLSKRYIPADRMVYFRERGHAALKLYIPARTTMFAHFAKPEVDFRNEGVLIGEAHLGGKIDRLEIDKANKTVRIVDFKTGSPHSRWEKSVKLLKYRQQLYFYKLLIEGSHTWSGYTVEEARLEFVEPDATGKIVDPLTIAFDQTEEQALKVLIKSIWHRIKTVDLPNTSDYDATYTGSLEFIDSLLNI